MTYRLEILPIAMLDIEEAFLWYQAVSIQIRDRFQSQLLNSLEEVHSNPLAWHLLTSKARGKKLIRFPYLVIFIVQKELITVVALIHEKRNPKTWKRRLRRK